jgi:hypothetical protein
MAAEIRQEIPMGPKDDRPSVPVNRLRAAAERTFMEDREAFFRVLTIINTIANISAFILAIAQSARAEPM